MHLEITLTRDDYAEKCGHMSKLPALIELNNRDAVDGCSFLKVGQSISEERKDDDIAQYDAPTPGGAF